jgi:hypothetical protein
MWNYGPRALENGFSSVGKRSSAEPLMPDQVIRMGI